MSQPYSTTSLSLAAFLLANSFAPRPSLIGPRQVSFAFVPVDEEAKERLVRLLADYSGGLAQVEPQAYHRALTALRRKIVAILELASQLN